MKILKKPKFKKLTCTVCDCVFVPGIKEIFPTVNNAGKTIRLQSRCPVCHNMEDVTPKKKQAIKAETSTKTNNVKDEPLGQFKPNFHNIKPAQPSASEQVLKVRDGSPEWEARE